MLLARITLVVAVGAGMACGGTEPAPAGTPAPAAAPAPAPAAAEDPQAALMKVGLDALYQRADYEAAIAAFRQVLTLNPTHYGAHYQLATALDRAGKPAEARPLWEKVLTMAEGYKDNQTAVTARIRLARTNP